MVTPISTLVPLFYLIYISFASGFPVLAKVIPMFLFFFIYVKRNDFPKILVVLLLVFVHVSMGLLINFNYKLGRYYVILTKLSR